MDDYLITEDCADNSDAQSEITRGAHLNGIVSKKFLFLRISECFVAFSRLENPMAQRQIFGIFKHLINAPSGFHGTGDGQTAVLLEKKLSPGFSPASFFHNLFHMGDFCQRRFDQPVLLFCFRKAFHDQRRKALQPLTGVLNVPAGQRKGFADFLKGKLSRVYPQDLLSPCHLFQQGTVLNLLFQVFHSFSSRLYET